MRSQLGCWVGPPRNQWRLGGAGAQCCGRRSNRGPRRRAKCNLGRKRGVGATARTPSGRRRSTGQLVLESPPRRSFRGCRPRAPSWSRSWVGDRRWSESCPPAGRTRSKVFRSGTGAVAVGGAVRRGTRTRTRGGRVGSTSRGRQRQPGSRWRSRLADSMHVSAAGRPSLLRSSPDPPPGVTAAHRALTKRAADLCRPVVRYADQLRRRGVEHHAALDQAMRRWGR